MLVSSKITISSTFQYEFQQQQITNKFRC